MAQAFPLRLRKGRVPEGLRLGATEDVFAETLQFFSPATVQEFIVFPILCREFDSHNI
jgi:hypothetical protein